MLIASLASIQLLLVVAAYDEGAQQCEFVKPPMGWNSYDSTIGNSGINESYAKSAAAFVQEHLSAVGYEYIVLDSGWFGIDSQYGAQLVDKYGRLIPQPGSYPSAAGGAGFKPLADHIHLLGLKFGFWIMGGVPWEAVRLKTPVLGTNYTADQIVDLSNSSNCGWNKWLVYGSKKNPDGTMHPGAVAYYESIASLYAGWGADIIKMDCVFGGNYDRGKIEMDQFAVSMKAASVRANRSVLLSLSPGSSTALAPTAQAFAKMAGMPVMARMTRDFWDHWDQLYTHFDTAAEAAPFVTSSFYPDLDMLPIGFVAHVGGPHYANFNLDEQRTLMSQWVMARAPLIWGGAAVPARVNATTMGLIANEEVVRVGSTSCGNKLLRRVGNVTVWAAVAKHPGTSRYIALFNLGEEVTTVTQRLDDTDIPGPPLPTPTKAGAYTARNLWSHTDQPVGSNGVLSAALGPHSCALFLVSPAATPSA
jgi:hypothetical protein